MRTNRFVLALTIGTALGGLSAFPAAAQEKLKVVATFSIISDMVENVASDTVELTTLVGPDGDAHVYEPTPTDARALSEADILIVNGLEFESWLPRLVDASGFAGTQIVATTGIEPIAFEEAGHEDEASGEQGHGAAAAAPDHENAAASPAGGDDHDHAPTEAVAAHDHDDAPAATAEAGHEGHDHGANDPHAWQDLANGVVYVRNIIDGLAEADAANAETYRSQGEAYIAELQSLDERITADFEAIPEAQRKVVTPHDAFGYFARAYDIEFIAPAGSSTDSEASAGGVAAIVDQIRAENISAVFMENVTDSRMIEQIARETDASIGGTLHSDALSGPEGSAPTYIEMFEHNASELLAAMSGS